MMHRTCTGLMSRRMISKISSVFASSDAVSSHLPNPCIAMAPDLKHIVCYHPEKTHPYEYTRQIDRNDPSLAQSDTVFNTEVQQDFDNRYYKKQVSKKDFRLETDQLAQMFNEHPSLFKLTPRIEKIRRAPQFRKPPPDRSGI